MNLTPVIEVSQGKLRGFRRLNGQNHYYGIPYATSKRFQSPKPPAKWNGVFDALFQFDSCSQSIGILQFGIEDCLKLDIYTPGDNDSSQKLPVLVFFHGGAYFFGSKWNYDPEFLVNKNVIVIVANYRLGILGFLCLGNVANLGLKDQLAALKWIKKNIAAFRGDPDNVTLSGQSAGSTSTSMHILSKRSKGLFHKAIMMSGNAFVPWAFNVDPLTPAFEDASKIRRVTNENDVYNTFLKASINDLLAATQDTMKNFKYFKYSPCGDYNFTEPFLHDSPYNIIRSGDFNKVPVIIGFTDLEGLLFYGLNSQTDLEYLENNLAQMLPSIFSWCSNKDKRKIARKIHSHYFKEREINSKASIKDGIDLYSDWMSYASTDVYSKLMAHFSDKPVYNYLFSYEGRRNFVKLAANSGLGIRGAMHCDDMFYAFKPAGITLALNNGDKFITEVISTIFTNFMKYGNPTPTRTKLLPFIWPRTTANRSQIMRIDQPLSVIDTPSHLRGEFFLSLLCEYGFPGFVPCNSARQCNLDI